MAATLPQSTPGRLAWADAAKGLCIALVVLYHVVGKHYDQVLPAELASVATAWALVGYAPRPLRMPLFFVLSGMFAARALQRPWRQALGPRVLALYYLYAVVAAYAALGAVGLGIGLTPDATKLLTSLAAVPLGIVAVVGLGRWPRVLAATAWFGKRTLPVYVLHVPLLSVVAHLSMAWPSTGPLAPWQVAALVVQPLLVTAVIVAAALALHAVVLRSPLWWLFRAPDWLRRAPGRAPQGPVAVAEGRGAEGRGDPVDSSAGRGRGATEA